MNVEQFKARLSLLVKPFYVRVALFFFIVSFFYNLPAISYSLKGSNQFRLYDVFGLVLLFEYFRNTNLINFYVKRVVIFKYLGSFIIWCFITLFLTAIFSFAKNRPLWIIQTTLYFYHFVVFYLFSVFISILLFDKKYYKRIVYLLLGLMIAESLLVIAQNLSLIPFLWNEAYRISYLGFLSGTLGPNKIVLGMTMFFSFVFCIGVYFQKEIKINRIFLISALTLTGGVLAISGSRTSYLAFFVFAAYVLIMRTKKFISIAVVLGVFVFVSIYLDLEIVQIVEDVFSNRIFDKIKDPTVLREGNVDDLYEDLGSGRKDLSIKYLNYLSSKPYIIPFGIGLNNRLLIGSSAHNIYLTLINEVGLLGLFLYMRWLFSYLTLNMRKIIYLRTVLRGFVLSMLVTLFFGEHLYIYRPLFALLGFFLFITVLLSTPRFYIKNAK